MISSGSSAKLKGGKKGLEKESLRINTEGTIAQTRHPHAWGSPLTHPYITTDYSESLPELITPPFAETSAAIGFLEDVHKFLHQDLEVDEMLWAASMPCAVSEDSSIPIAQYGSSNIGRMKHVYRVGLDYRYGRRMQAIAGVHFNYSLPEPFWAAFKEDEKSAARLQGFINDRYFALIRNFKRFGWIIPFLFGMSPVVCKSFLAGRTTRFKEFTRGTYYLPYATSLRMSDIGYKNKNQSALRVSYDDLNSYVGSLRKAIRTPYPEYEAIGVRDGDTLIQLSTNVLQIENEYYSFVRPKRTAHSGERPTSALSDRGVEYVEIRALDVNCMNPIGVEIEQLYFLEAFLIFCLLEESDALTDDELRAIEYNELTVALRGRSPGLELVFAAKRRPIREWSLEICDRMQPICEFLDEGGDSRHYQEALRRQVSSIETPELLPAAKVLQGLRDANEPFHNYTMDLSVQHKEHFRSHPPSEQVRTQFEKLALESHEERRRLESGDSVAFEDYVKGYLEV